MDIRHEVNRRITEIRESAITSQAALARRLDVDPSQLNRQLAGREAMSDERREEIGRLLGLEMIGGAR